MTEGKLGRRYARAIFQLARDNHREEATGQEIDRFVHAYTTAPLKTVLNNPAFGLTGRKGVVVEVAKGLEISDLIIRFFSLLIERDRLSFLPSIATHYHRLLDEAMGRVKARVAVPTLLDAAALENLRAALQKISGKEVILEEEIDSGLIGGALIELEGKVYDGSVHTQLERIKESIERGY